jgi:hypothetical protein
MDVSCFEVYMNCIRDLLVADTNPDANIASHLVESFDVAVRLLTRAFKKRKAISYPHI